MTTKQVDVGDAVLVLRRLVGLVAAHGEQAAVNLRMQRLDPAVHDFGEPGMSDTSLTRDAGFRDGPGRAAGGDNFDTMIAQGLGESDQSGLSETDMSARLIGRSDVDMACRASRFEW